MNCVTVSTRPGFSRGWAWVFVFCGLPLVLAQEGPKPVVVAPESEPGQRLEVSGAIFQSDGVTPVAGAEVHVYQTDKDGRYGRPGKAERHLHGDMVTDDQGRFRFSTIKPGSYPGTRAPAHIHMVLKVEGQSERRLELRFVGDPYLSEATVRREGGMGKFAQIQPLTEDGAGGLKCTWNIRL